MEPITTAAAAPRRVALVVGNGAYETASRLAAPRLDAIRMGSLLERLGFEVMVATDCDYADFRSRLRDFADRLGDAGLALFYFSGHGVAAAGAANHLLPVDADIREAEDLGRVTVPLGRVLDHMQAPGRVCLLFLDACHDDPFAGRPAGPAAKAVLTGQPGLQAVPREALTETLIGFAADEGRTAQDGDGGFSPFTAALAEAIVQPGQEIRDVMRDVRRRVAEATQGRQQPWYKDKLTAPVVLVPGEPATVAAQGGAPAGRAPLGLPMWITRGGTWPKLVHAAPTGSLRRATLPAVALLAVAVPAGWMLLDDARGVGCGLVEFAHCQATEVDAGDIDRLVGDLMGDERVQAERAAASLGRLLENPLISAGQRRALVMSILADATPDRLARMTPEGRESLLGMLAGVPAEFWQQPEDSWPMEAAHAVIRAFDAAPERIALTAPAATSLGALKTNAAYFLRPHVTVYTQYVGYREADARAVVSYLNDRFGWTAWPPSPVARDDVGTAWATHQVRYDPASPGMELAARLIAAELSCAGAPAAIGCRRALAEGGPLPVFDPHPEPAVDFGHVEIWMAN